jgi:tetraacyldisaccharide 4'-kinase
MRYLLLPFSWFYGAAMLCRNMAFDMDLLKSKSAGVPVISVGNMTMGGTGKTPLVEHIVGECIAQGRKVAVVSRGYKRESNGVMVVSNGREMLVDATQGGDEPVQIARKHPKAIVVVGERRVDAAQRAVHEFKANVVVLDDGFQHRYLKRDLDIVVIDARKNLFALPLLPAGERREPVSGLRRAGLIAFSHVDEVPKDNEWPKWLSGKFPAPRISYRYKLDHIKQAGSDRELTTRDLKGRKMLLFSGIGDHQGFVRQMSRAGVDFSDDIRFPDHHAYSQNDLNLITNRVVEKRCRRSPHDRKGLLPALRQQGLPQ